MANVITREKLLTVAQVAARLNCNSKLVYGLIQEGKLSAVRLGKKNIRIKESELIRFLETMEIDPQDYCL